MTAQELINRIEAARRALHEDVPELIAETAVAHYKERFEAGNKDWDGVPWPQAKNPPHRGSLMMRSGNLQSSIRPALISPDRVVINAGSDKVPYAKAHNEGEHMSVQIPITPKMRKFAWAKHYETGEDQWKGLALTKKKHLSLDYDMPKRQFIGMSGELSKGIQTAIINHLNSMLK